MQTLIYLPFIYFSLPLDELSVPSRLSQTDMGVLSQFVLKLSGKERKYHMGAKSCVVDNVAQDFCLNTILINVWTRQVTRDRLIYKSVIISFEKNKK